MEDKKISVFIIDSSDVWRKILRNHISSSPDMEVAGEINSGQGGVFLLSEINPDIVLLDATGTDRMPVTKTVSQLKAVCPLVRIVLCVDTSRLEDIMSAVDLGAYDFVTKPYHRMVIWRIIRECMEKPVSR